MKIKDAIDEVILQDIEELKNAELGSDQRKALMNEISTFTERRTEMKRTIENRFQEVTKTAVSIAAIVVPAVVTIWGTTEVLKFEEEGTITTNVGRGFMNRLIPKG